jgi:isopenicillin N synthase-like dioxygenase
MLQWIDYRSTNLGKSLLSQFQHLGFAVLCNSPRLSSRVVHHALEATHKLFQLDSAAKNSARCQGEMRHSSRGYYTFKQQSKSHIEAFQIGCKDSNLFDARLDYFESSGLMEIIDSQLIRQMKTTRNVWPDEFAQGHRDALLEYFQCASDLCAEILDVLHREIREQYRFELELDCLMTSEDYDENVMKSLHDKNDHILELKHYHSPDSSSFAAKSTRFSPHKDLSSLTVLIQDAISGLEVFNESTLSWIPVNFSSKEHPNCILLNSGDFLEIMSGGICRSTLHRVTASGQPSPRNSLAFFYSPNWNSRLTSSQNPSVILAGDQMPSIL